jgi:hypothetical protein
MRNSADAASKYLTSNRTVQRFGSLGANGGPERFYIFDFGLGMRDARRPTIQNLKSKIS